MKTLVVDHNDADGIGCWIILDYFKIPYDKVELCDYSMFENDVKFNTILDYDKYIITDFSLPNEMIEKLLALGKIVEIYDHHESSERLKEIVHPSFKLVHDKTKAGTLIVFEQFMPKNVRVKKIIREFAILVSTYDLYKTDDPLWEDAQNINRILWGCLDWDAEGLNRFTFIKDYWFNKINNNNEWFWTPFEQKKITSAINSENKAYVEACSTYKSGVDSKGYKFGTAVLRSKISIVANRLLKEKPEIDYIVMINTYEGWGKLSLRSLDKFDCTRIASGHLSAAGMSLSQEDAVAFYKGTYSLKYKEDEIAT